jgi:hypothetical protein
MLTVEAHALLPYTWPGCIGCMVLCLDWFRTRLMGGGLESELWLRVALQWISQMGSAATRASELR